MVLEAGLVARRPLAGISGYSQNQDAYVTFANVCREAAKDLETAGWPAHQNTARLLSLAATLESLHDGAGDVLRDKGLTGTAALLELLTSPLPEPPS